MRILSFVKDLSLLTRYPPYLSMIAREVEEFHLCHVKGKLEEKSIIFHRLRIPRTIHFSSLLLALPTALKAFKICRKYGINVIYVLDGVYYELSGLLTSKLSRTPLVVRLRTNEVKLRQLLRYNIIKRTLGDFLTKLVVTKAKRVICISHELQNLVLAWNVDPSKVVIVRNGVDTKNFRLMKVEKPFPKVALFIGSFRPEKGASTLLKTAKYLESIHFFIIGPQPTSVQIAGIPKNVHYLGFVKRDHMPHYYNMSDVLVLPSFTEGLPDVILEAFACGKPVIASRVGEIPWIVPPEFGWIVEPGDVKQLKEAILNALSDKKRLEAMGEAAREYVVKNFKWSLYVEEMIKTLSEYVD